ncbi:MAG: undecaprenyldiphospho-muramoylpentapeptide beta-N-acetylglucosaminyltransferase [Spirochaetales bacterium]|nr:undecaprenyldiphospho-muramoylpentapeptide beta-N-acetylglucosaminyltransferase [Spirochaetales bacterium]
MKKCVVFTGGGTGGHVFPGLAVIDPLRQAWHGGEIVWIGSVSGIERKIVESHGIPYYGIPAGKLRRYLSIRNFLDMFNVLAGVVCSVFLLLRLRPLLVFSKGGYVSVPAVIACGLLRLPVFTHESDVSPGFATRINARFAECILTSFRETSDYFPPPMRCKIVHTGNPVRKSIAAGDPKRGKRAVGCPESRKLLLILGGSQGARSLNRAIDTILERLLRQWFVVHQMGGKLYRKREVPGYFPAPFFTEDLPHILAAADLVVSRAGANILWELAVSGTPSILIPLVDGSRGDQIRNARHFMACGASIVVEEGPGFSKKLLDYIEILFNNDTKREEMAVCAKNTGLPDAADGIVTLILKRVKGEVVC